MFKLGAITDEISQDFERAVDVCKEYDLQTVEIRSVWDKPSQDLTDTDVAAIQAVLSARGLTVSCLASPFFKCDIDDEEAGKKHLDILRNCARLARKLGTNLVRVFTFWNTGKTHEIWDRILERYQEPIAIAEEEDVILAVENEASTSISTARLLEKFLREIDSPRVRAVWDPGNEVHAPDGERPYPEAFDRVKDLMVHFHLKDVARDPQTGKPRAMPVGEGSIDYMGQLRALLAMGYQGAVSLETHWRPKELPKDMIDKPGGKEFSSEGEYASRVCLDNLLKIVRQIA
jgi:sugar phosphate isomerase/epimerase